ncbi:outer membrane protein [Bradyrhizobium sp.]|uniref:outer membrane protein n=1 Tax=Bradyrhizobium sp. TaxID=376 RepID=UPI003C740943
MGDQASAQTRLKAPVTAAFLVCTIFATLLKFCFNILRSMDELPESFGVRLCRDFHFPAKPIEDFMGCSRLIASVAISVIISASAASAADLPVPVPVYTKAPVMVTPTFDWSGFYLGGHAGRIWGKSRVFENGVLTESGAPTDGSVGGFLAGYNWRAGPLVLGIEGDFGWSDAQGHGTGGNDGSGGGDNGGGNSGGGNNSGGNSGGGNSGGGNSGGGGSGAPSPPSSPREPNTYNLRWDSHFVGRAGFASDRWLIFATGGLAIAGFDFQEGVAPPASPPNSISARYVGFSVGAGVEYAFTQNLLGRLQYIYDDFGSKNYAAVDGGTYRVRLTGQTLRGALSWKF